MDSILAFASQATPITIIALLVVIVFQLLGGKSLISKIRGTQEEKYPEMTGLMSGIAELTKQNETLLENHFRHEIPELMATQARLETKLDKMNDTLIRIESKMK